MEHLNSEKVYTFWLKKTYMKTYDMYNKLICLYL